MTNPANNSNDSVTRFSLLELGDAPQTQAQPVAPTQPAPQPAPQPVMMEATFAHVAGRGSDWGLRFDGTVPPVGTVVSVRRRNGSTSEAIVGAIVKRDSRGTVCEIGVASLTEIAAQPIAVATASNTDALLTQLADLRTANPVAFPTLPEVAAPAPQPTRNATMMEAAAISEAFTNLSKWSTQTKAATALCVGIAALACVPAMLPRTVAPQTLGAQMSAVTTPQQARTRLASSRQQNPRRSASARYNTRSQTAQQLRRASRRDEIVLTLTDDDTALGIQTDWNGQGELTVAQCDQILTDSGLDLDLAPNGLTAKAALGKAIGLLRSRGYSCNYQTKGAKQPNVRSYSSRYTVGNVDHTSGLGESLGSKVATCTLYPNGDLECEGPHHLTALVTIEYERCTRDRVLTAGKVSDWVASVLVREFDAVRFGPGWFVPAPFATAETFVNRVAQSFGCDWYDKCPRLTTRESIGANIAGGLIREIATIAKQMDTAETVAAEKKDNSGKPGTIRENTAIGYLASLNDVADRARLFLKAMDSASVDRVVSQADALIKRCQVHTSGTAQRGALIWADLKREGSVDWA